ncbi:MAG: dTDP-4-dehydrorhamnose reductase [bacterium]
MKVAVIGANGQLGTEICEIFSQKYLVISLTHQDFEISDIDNVKNTLERVKPQVVINTAAYHQVSKCEENPILSFKINGLGALNLSKVSNDLDFKLVHFSTDYVFDGLKKSPYIEDDKPNPLNIYGLTKLNGEHLIMNNCNNYFIIRVSGIYGKVPCRAKGGNFITTMIKASRERPEVTVVNDEILTPTSAVEISKNTYSLIQTDAFGLYHMTCQGGCSWYEFAKVIFETLKLEATLQPCSVSDFPMTVKRPIYSVLENHNLKAIKMDQMIFWKDALVNFLNETNNM